MIDKNQATDFEEERDDAVIGRAFRWSLAVIFALVGIACAAGYLILKPEPSPEMNSTDSPLPIVREETKAKIPYSPFVDITAAAGIDFVHENGAYGDKLLPETMGGGCAFLDYDNDGDPDILLVNSNRWPWDKRPASTQATMKLYRNDRDEKFTDVTADVGLDVSFYGMGAAVGDYDNDGNVDIFISAVGKNRLFRNTGGQFVDATSAAGLGGGDDWSTSCAFFDYNNDGLLDLFVCNYVNWSKETDLSQGFRLVGVGRAYGPPTAFEGSLPYLYRNDGDGGFTDVSEPMGVQVKNHLTGVPMAKSMGVSPIDVDNDGWIDLVVANDTIQNFLFHNQGGKKFEEIGTLAGIAFDSKGQARGAMGTDTAYYRNDGVLSVAIGNFSNEMTALYVCRDNNMQFLDAAIASGLGPQTRLELTFGLFFFDYDLDGRLDLLASNGHLEEEINKVQASQFYAQPPQLFWNAGRAGGTEFVPVSVENVGKDFSKRMVGRGATFADIDGDGDLDALLTASGGSPRLLRNDQQLENTWIRFKLTGTKSNRDAIGAWIEIRRANDIIRRQVMPSRSYLSQAELPVTIGLGEEGNKDIKSIIIRWPSGIEQQVTDVKFNALNELTEPEE